MEKSSFNLSSTLNLIVTFFYGDRNNKESVREIRICNLKTKLSINGKNTPQRHSLLDKESIEIAGLARKDDSSKTKVCN